MDTAFFPSRGALEGLLPALTPIPLCCRVRGENDIVEGEFWALMWLPAAIRLLLKLPIEFIESDWAVPDPLCDVDAGEIDELE